MGGSGTRLWPASRKSYPKQFSNLIGERSLFQETLLRLSGEGFGAPLVLTNADFRFLATDQIQALGIEDATILIEPEGRNTAPAVLTAALKLEDEPDALMLVAPSDHVMADPEAFREAVRAGEAAARDGQLVTFGISPTRPETGYGYLELPRKPGATAKPTTLKGFTEKPDAEKAKEMIATGRFLWNAGIFLFRVGDIIAAFETHAKKLIKPCRDALKKGEEDLSFFRLDGKAYAKAEDISLDYAVMEKAANLSVVPYGGGWSDLGSWDALWTELGPDEQGVVTTGPATAVECRNTYLRAEEGNQHLVGLGLKDIVAVAMRDAVLVADMDSRARRSRTVVNGR